jgi:2-polyprenyl-3-methyl-5-hydroxy-6-metoxy-1,4-benzoquinol methylase
MSSYRWMEEPVRVLFVLARYKWVAQMLRGYQRVLEVGCGDGLGSALVRDTVGHLTAIDQDPMMIESAKRCQKGIDFKCTGEIEVADAIYSIDVIEHIEREESRKWVSSLSANADMVIIGSPSLESQIYASPLSRQNHINCMTQPELKAMMKDYFKHVLMFSMNDECVHTGFSKMSHYNFAMGIN